MDAGIARAGLDGYAARQADTQARGRVRGFGLALCIETAGGMWGRRGADWTNVELHGDAPLIRGQFERWKSDHEEWDGVTDLIREAG